MLFLTKMIDSNQIEEELQLRIKSKCLSTLLWLISILTQDSHGKSWDGAQWDTAVTLRVIVICQDSLKDIIDDATKENLHRLSIDIC
jgi:hypothetical protein